MNENYQSHAKTRLITAVVAIVVIAGIILLIDYFQNRTAGDTSAVSSDGSSTTQQSSASNSSGSNEATSAATYKDGTYTAGGQYYVPHGYEDIKVILTVKNNIVTDSELQNSENDPESARFQEDFTAGYKSYVVGKKIGDINLPYIAGASDTTRGFNDALNQIRHQAQA